MDSSMPTSSQQNRTGELYGSVTTLIVIATIAVILRLFARKISAASFWWDDWTIIIAWILFLGAIICVCILARDYGLGRHTTLADGPVDLKALKGFSKVFLAITILYIATSTAFKTSLILLYYRLFGVVRTFRYTLAVIECMVVGYFLACLIIAIFQCRPVSRYWDNTIPGTCINEVQFYWWMGIANLGLDLTILCLTFPMVWRLKIAFRQKVTLSSIFLLGTFVFAASIVRVISINRIKLEDITYTTFSTVIWSVMEESLGITCACLPTLRPLFGRIIFGRANSDGSGTLNNGEHSEIQLSKLSGKPTIRRSSGDEIARGFVRLPEENMLPSSITTYVTTGPMNDEEIEPNAILRSQLIEQHYDSMERV